jgi:hypothetical protein
LRRRNIFRRMRGRGHKRLAWLMLRVRQILLRGRVPLAGGGPRIDGTRLRKRLLSLARRRAMVGKNLVEEARIGEIRDNGQRRVLREKRRLFERAGRARRSRLASGRMPLRPMLLTQRKMLRRRTLHNNLRGALDGERKRRLRFFLSREEELGSVNNGWGKERLRRLALRTRGQNSVANGR